MGLEEIDRPSGICCCVAPSAECEDGVIHGLGSHFNGLNLVGGQGLQRTAGDRIGSGGKTDALHFTLFYKALGLPQERLPVRQGKAQKSSAIKGHLNPPPVFAFIAEGFSYPFSNLLR